MTAGIEQALGNSISNRYGWYIPQIADFQDTLR
jgi:hypothetical protein